MPESNPLNNAMRFSPANQPQISVFSLASVAVHVLIVSFFAVRAHQKDLIYISNLKDQTEGVLRSWLGLFSHLPVSIELILRLEAPDG